MTAARSWLRDHWHPLVIAATAIMVAAIFAGVLALAQAQRHSLRLNDLCDPTQPGGVVLPEPEETP